MSQHIGVSKDLLDKRFAYSCWLIVLEGKECAVFSPFADLERILSSLNVSCLKGIKVSEGSRGIELARVRG